MTLVFPQGEDVIAGPGTPGLPVYPNIKARSTWWEVQAILDDVQAVGEVTDVVDAVEADRHLPMLLGLP